MNHDNPIVWIRADEWVIKAQEAIISGLKITAVLKNPIKKTLTSNVINEMLSWAKTVIKTKYKPKYFLQSEITVSLWAGNLWACINHSTWYKTQQKTELLFLNLYNNLFYALSVFASWNSFFINPFLYIALSKIKTKNFSISVEQYTVNLAPQVAQNESNHSIYSHL